MAIYAKFKGKPGEYLGGVPDKDLDEAEFSALTDEQKAAVNASALYDLRGDAPKEAAAAERRVARAEDVVVPAPAAAPKDGG